MNLQEKMIYNVILNKEKITLSELREYFNLSVNNGVSLTSKESREFMTAINNLIKDNAVIKSSDYEKGVIYRISDQYIKAELA